jgi:hypothetical protein
VWPKLPATRARWARALQWEPDAFDRLLDGEQPRILPFDVERVDNMLKLLEEAIAVLRSYVNRGMPR